jgi:hypothetical protein
MEALDLDQEDPSGLNKASVLSLVKVVLYFGSAEDELVAELVATVLLYVPYNSDFNLQLYQVRPAGMGHVLDRSDCIFLRFLPGK